MQYLYEENAGEKIILLGGDNYKYLVKVRRFKEGKELHLRNLQDSNLYIYKIEQITKKELKLSLVETKKQSQSNEKNLHILWCIIDPKTIYQTLPMLNQIGVRKISFIYCQRSQRNFVLDLNKIKKILINSSQQCGRMDLMEIEVIDDLELAICSVGFWRRKRVG